MEFTGHILTLAQRRTSKKLESQMKSNFLVNYRFARAENAAFQHQHEPRKYCRTAGEAPERQRDAGPASVAETERCLLRIVGELPRRRGLDSGAGIQLPTSWPSQLPAVSASAVATVRLQLEHVKQPVAGTGTPRRPASRAPTVKTSWCSSTLLGHLRYRQRASP
jgi:hypothetical protein